MRRDEQDPVVNTSGDRLQIKANRKLLDGSKVTNGELVTVRAELSISPHARNRSVPRQTIRN